jgi:hypothetical protein
MAEAHITVNMANLDEVKAVIAGLRQRLADSLNLDGFDRLFLTGDEYTGVGLNCSDHWAGGRPLGYLGGYQPYGPEVAYPATIVELLTVGRKHLDEHHRTETP